MKSSKQILALLLSTALLLACFGCQKNGALTARGQADAVPATQGTASRPTEPAPDQPAGSPAAAEDVLRELRTHAADYGLENALSELELKSETIIDGDSYYRFQQNYRGVPVYGRTVVCMVGKDGTMAAQAGNLADIGEGLDLAFSLDEREAAAVCEAYFGNGAAVEILSPVSDESGCIFNLFEQTPCAAYDLLVSSAGEYYNMVVSSSGEVLLCCPCRVEEEGETVTGTGEDVDGDSATFNTFRKTGEESVLLYDAERNLIVYDAAGETLNTDFSFTDLDGNQYHTQTLVDNLGESSTFTLIIRERDDEAVDGAKLDYDPSSLAWHYTTRESGRKPKVPTSASEVWTDRKQVTAMSRTAEIYDFYRTILHRRGFDGNGSKMTIVINDLGAKSIVAFSKTPISHTAMTMISFYEKMSVDVMAHEYTHSVEASESGMIYQNESGAIMEALSDIFGELVQDYADDGTMNGRCDWKLHSRNLADPHGSGNPAVYHGTGWKPTYTSKDDINKKGNDRGHVHNNSTVISHAAYLMWKGIDGTNEKKLSTEQLAKLWYRAMLMMPSDCDFVTCRKMVELAAQSVNLTTEQIACVSEAFEAVGITIKTESSDYIIGPGSTFVVLDASGQPYSSYSYQITGTRSAVSTLENGSYSRTVTVSDSDPQSLTLPEGDYSIRVIDHVDARQTVTFTVDYDIYAPAKEIVVATNFKSPTEADPVSEMYEAYYGLCMERQSEYGVGKRKDNCLLGLSVVRLVDFDGDGTEELYLAWWDQAKQHSGLEIWTYDNGLSRVYETEKFYCASQDTYHEHYLRYTSAGGKTYLWTEDPGLGADRMDWKSELLELKNGVFTPVKTWAFTYLWEGEQVTRYIDGQQVDEETFDDDYYRNMSEHYETTEFLFLLYWEDDSQRITLDETEKTLARLSLKDGEITYTAFPEVPAPYAAFLQSRGYEEYYRDRIQVWDESGSVQARYAVYDVNADGVPELLIYRWESEFGDLMVFTQTASGAVAYAGTLGMFLFPSYSAANNSLVFLSMRPVANGSPMDRDYDYAFVQLQGQDLAGLGHANYNTGKEQWTFIDAGLTVDVDEAEDIPFTDFP